MMRNLGIVAVALACAVPTQAATYSYGGSVFVEIDPYVEINSISIHLPDSEDFSSFYWNPQPNRTYDLTLTLSRPSTLAQFSTWSDRGVRYQEWAPDGTLWDDYGYSWNWDTIIDIAENATVLRGRYTPFTYTDERHKTVYGGRWRQRARTYTHPGYADLEFKTEGMLDYTVTISGPVPEPASWAMMIAGFGLVGAALRRRNGSFARA